jgi:hypothetical protein
MKGYGSTVLSPVHALCSTIMHKLNHINSVSYVAFLQFA